MRLARFFMGAFVILIHLEIGQEFKNCNLVCLTPPSQPFESTSSCCPVLPHRAFELHDQFEPIFSACVSMSAMRYFSKFHKNRNERSACRTDSTFVLKTERKKKEWKIPLFVLSLSSYTGRRCYECLLSVKNFWWSSHFIRHQRIQLRETKP